MKLLQINICVNIKSTGRIVEQLNVLAQQSGFEIYAAGWEIQSPTASTIYRIGNICSRFYHRVQARFFDRQGRASQKATRYFIQWIQQIQPDVIHLHNLHCAYLNYPLLFDFLKSYGKPVVWTLHDCWPFTGHCAHFESIGCEKWKSACEHCPQIPFFSKDDTAQNYALKKQYFTSLPNLTLVAISNWMERLLDSSFLTNIPKVLIPNGVDVNLFHPYDKKVVRRELGLDEEAFWVMGAASAWSDEKGLQEMIKLSSHPDIKLLMLGVSPSLQKQLPASIVTLPLIKEQALLAKYYSAADVFVNPTHNDTSSTVNMEALACARPIVCYRSGGAIEIIDEQTGIGVPRGDYKALLEGVLSLKGHSMGESCRARAIQLYDKNKNFERYIELYRSLCK
jgi:glycosyltransferase involved in cell wall biosynthesis